MSLHFWYSTTKPEVAFSKWLIYISFLCLKLFRHPMRTKSQLSSKAYRANRTGTYLPLRFHLDLLLPLFTVLKPPWNSFQNSHQNYFYLRFSYQVPPLHDNLTDHFLRDVFPTTLSEMLQSTTHSHYHSSKQTLFIYLSSPALFTAASPLDQTLAHRSHSNIF